MDSASSIPPDPHNDIEADGWREFAEVAQIQAHRPIADSDKASHMRQIRLVKERKACYFDNTLFRSKIYEKQAASARESGGVASVALCLRFPTDGVHLPLVGKGQSQKRNRSWIQPCTFRESLSPVGAISHGSETVKWHGT